MNCVSTGPGRGALLGALLFTVSRWRRPGSSGGSKGACSLVAPQALQALQTRRLILVYLRFTTRELAFAFSFWRLVLVSVCVTTRELAMPFLSFSRRAPLNLAFSFFFSKSTLKPVASAVPPRRLVVGGPRARPLRRPVAAARAAFSAAAAALPPGDEPLPEPLPEPPTVSARGASPQPLPLPGEIGWAAARGEGVSELWGHGMLAVALKVGARQGG